MKHLIPKISSGEGGLVMTKMDIVMNWVDVWEG